MNFLDSGLIQKDHLLADYSSWRVGGLADYFSAPGSVDELKSVLTWARKNEHPVTLFSGGSNVLFSDKGIRGLTIGLSCINGTEIEEDGETLKLASWAGSSKAELLKIFLKYKLAPAMMLAGLPGDVGGGVVMNAGVNETFPSPREFCEFTSWVEVLRWDGAGGKYEVIRILGDQLKWTYRHSDGWQPGIIIRVGVEWPNEPDEAILDNVRKVSRERLSRQPLSFPSCGSVFRNPPGNKAGALIEEAGLKGFTVGGAKVSEKHSNFIVNFESARATDIDQVLKHVQSTVKKKSGVELQTEVVYLGDW